MEVRERIAKIIASEGLTASAFADMIGIQRSNVSHILNGRNGPSLELLQKILNTFPQYNTEWLVMGRGEIYRQPVQTSIFDILGDDSELAARQPGTGANTAPDGGENASNQAQNANTNIVEPEMPQTPSDNTQTQSTAANTEQSAPAAELTSVLAHAAQHQAEVKQVVVLYTDNTFVAYNKQ